MLRPRLQRDFSLPRALGEAQRLNAMLPPRPSSLLLPQILEQFLPPVYQQPQIPLIVLVSLSSCHQEVAQCPDLRRKDGNLYFGGPGIRPDALLDLFDVGFGAHGVLFIYKSGRLWGEYTVSVVATESLDAAGNVNAHAVLRRAVGQGSDARDSLGSPLVVLLAAGFYVSDLLSNRLRGWG